MTDFDGRRLEAADVISTMSDGIVSDFDLLPKNLGMQVDDRSNTNPDIKLGDLEFDYSVVKQEVLEKKSRLRLSKSSVDGRIIGFTIVSMDKDRGSIKMIWVDPLSRKSNLGEKLLRDAIEISPSQIIDVDIWGGEPANKLATKLGFKQNPGGKMANRYTLEKIPNKNN